MPQHRREVINQRRQQVAELYLKGKYQYEIAQLIGVTQQQISLDLKAVQQQWLASSIRDFDAVKAQEIAKLDHIEREALEAWTLSRQPREVTVTKRITGKDPRYEASVRREHHPTGDPRFLQVAQRCVEQRCDLLGLSTAAEAAKALGSGLAALLVQAQGTEPPSLPMAEA
jgi:hypothetical protein